MQKTKLGITVGLMGAIIYFMGLISGYLLTVLLVGYVLLVEENLWLKKQGVKALLLMGCFSLASLAVGLIPDLLEIVNNIIGIFGGYISFNFVYNLINLIRNVLNVVELVLFVLLGLKSFTQGTIQIPVVDNLVNKFMD
ncbi:MAG: hypothetical protein IKD06_05615 [Clostridia bacterium]|nr:hypothetical protein [Clostridia bacterium]